MTGTVSIMTLTAISFDRYQGIVHPLEQKTKTRTYIRILLIWVYGAFFSIIPLLNIGLNKYVPEGYLTSCSFDYLSKDMSSRIYVFVFFVAAWVIPISIIIGSYSALYKVVFKARSNGLNALGRHCKEIEVSRPELRAAFTVLFVVCLWTLSWTPYATIALLGITGNEKYISPLSSMIPALFCKTASCVDPFVYAVTNHRFRNELKNECKRSSRFQTSFRTDKRDFITVAEDTTEKGRQGNVPLVEAVDEIIAVPTSTEPNYTNV